MLREGQLERGLCEQGRRAFEGMAEEEEEERRL